VSIESDIQKLEPGTLIELYVLDMTAIGGGIAHFHCGTNKLQNPVIWQGVSYAPCPVRAEGFEVNGRGQSPRPKFAISNATGIMTALNRQYQDLVGARLVRKRTFARYLDAVNFPGGVNPNADPSAAFPDDVFFVEQKTSQDKTVCEYALAGIYDVEGVQIPFRQVIAGTCPSQYRGAECGYTGGPVADRSDAATSDPTLDDCGKRLSSCKLRFGATNELPFGGFPSAGKLVGK